MILFTPWAKRSYDRRHLCWQNHSTVEIPWVVKTAALSADGRPVVFKYECKWQKRCGPFPKAQGTMAALDENFLPAVSRAPLSLCRSLALSPPSPPSWFLVVVLEGERMSQLCTAVSPWKRSLCSELCASWSLCSGFERLLGQVPLPVRQTRRGVQSPERNTSGTRRFPAGPRLSCRTPSRERSLCSSRLSVTVTVAG